MSEVVVGGKNQESIMKKKMRINSEWILINQWIKTKQNRKQNNRIQLLFQKKKIKIHFKKKNKNDWNKGKRWRRKNEKNSIQLISFCMAFIIIIVIVVVGHHHHWWNPIVRQSDNNTKVFFSTKEREKEKNTHRNKRIGDVYEIPVTKHCIV